MNHVCKISRIKGWKNAVDGLSKTFSFACTSFEKKDLNLINLSFLLIGDPDEGFLEFAFIRSVVSSP
jgi:hypothetical protein